MVRSRNLGSTWIPQPRARRLEPWGPPHPSRRALRNDCVSRKRTYLRPPQDEADKRPAPLSSRFIFSGNRFSAPGRRRQAAAMCRSARAQVRRSRRRTTSLATMAVISTATMQSQTTNTPRRPRRDGGRGRGEDPEQASRAQTDATHAGGDTADCVAHRRILTELNFKSLPSELGIFMIDDLEVARRRYAIILSTDVCGLPFHRPIGHPN